MFVPFLSVVSYLAQLQSRLNCDKFRYCVTLLVREIHVYCDGAWLCWKLVSVFDWSLLGGWYSIMGCYSL